MAKGYNPADAHRKAQKAKEKKKNKQERVKAKELGDVKRNTGSIENEIRELSSKERNGTITASEKADLEAARAELTRLRKAKEDYVKANPEQRDAVMGTGRAKQDDGNASKTVNIQGVQISFRAKQEAEAQGLKFDKKGRLLNPEKSAYYDPTFNPFGVPPPGMPYRARPPTAEELAAIQAAQDAESSDEDDIVLPEGPRPDGGESDSEDDSDDSDDIAMPEGPPPPRPPSAISHNMPFPPQPPLPAQPLYPSAQTYSSYPPPPGFTSYPQGFMPPPPPPISAGPSRQFFQASPASAMSAAPMPPRPPPTISAQPSMMNGPVLASPPIPATGNIARPPLPPADPAAAAQIKASATISAAPQVRDLKKEALSFAPSALKRKRPGQAAAASASRKAVKSDERAGAVEPAVSEELRERASAMHLPPGFGAMSAGGPSRLSADQQYQVAEEVEEEEQGDGLGEEQMVALPPGFGRSSLPGFGDEDNGEMASVALPPGFGRSSYPAYEDEEDGQDDYQGPALPTGNAYAALPGFDDDDEEDASALGEEQGVSLPPGFPGHTGREDEGDDQGDVQGVALPPGFRTNGTSVTVEEDDEE